MKWFFKLLATINKWCLPSLIHTDLARLTKFQKLLVAYRYWVTSRAINQ